MKTSEIKYLINRAENIKKTTDKLARHSAKFASWLVDTMETAGIDEICGYSMYRRRTSSGATSTILVSDSHHCGGNLLEPEIGSGGYYDMGDYNCYVIYPCREEVVAFVRDIPKILTELARLAQENETLANRAKAAAWQ